MDSFGTNLTFWCTECGVESAGKSVSHWDKVRSNVRAEKTSTYMADPGRTSQLVHEKDNNVNRLSIVDYDKKISQ